MDVNAQTGIPPATTVGPVRLTVSDLTRSRSFYERVLGLEAEERGAGIVSLRAGGTALVELREDASASRIDHGAPGLYHFAVLMPDRRALAVALARAAAARWPLSGASDHLVSEALYLSDPDGIGIEIYRDRPRREWTYQDGQLAMSTLPLDLDDLITEIAANGELEPQAPPGTHMGHIHLQVSDLEAAEEFYSRVLGFEVTVRGYPGALFVSAGGYHHHIGLNTWNSRGARPRDPGGVGLDWFEIVVPGGEELEPIVARVQAANLDIGQSNGGWTTADPAGNRLLLRPA